MQEDSLGDRMKRYEGALNELLTWKKRGRCIRKMPTVKRIPKGPRAGEQIPVEDWMVDNEPPIFTQDRYYLERLFVSGQVKEAA